MGRKFGSIIEEKYLLFKWVIPDARRFDFWVPDPSLILSSSIIVKTITDDLLVAWV